MLGVGPYSQFGTVLQWPQNGSHTIALLATKHQAFNCCDRYIAEWDVAHLAKAISGSATVIHGRRSGAKNQIATEKLRSLGMEFGGEALLEATVRELVAAAGDS